MFLPAQQPGGSSGAQALTSATGGDQVAVVQQQPISAEQVLSVLQATLSNDNPTRAAAEKLLKEWESDAAPGFLQSLMRIVGETGAFDESMRLLAVVLAKNAVGSSWRKTLGSREWSRVPPEEKALVRQAAATLLLSDPSDRIARQLSLLLANIARFDFPGRAQDLLPGLLSACAIDSQLPLAAKLRALRALRDVLQALATKRFVIEPGAGGISDLAVLSQQIMMERGLFQQCIHAAFQPLQQLLCAHTDAFTSGAQGWQMHAEFARSAAAALAAQLPLAPTPSVLPAGSVDVLMRAHAACATIMKGGEPGMPIDPAQAGVWRELGGKLVERFCRLVIMYLDIYPVPFAEFVPPFLTLFVKNALIDLDAATVRSMRAKLRVLLVRFIAKSLLCPFYRPEWINAHMPVGASPAQRAAVAAGKGKALKAYEALSGLLSDEQGQCSQLVTALVAKYIALSGEELTEWQEDPESYARSMDVESSPDADTPRPIGVGLLLCMLEHGGQAVANALLQLAAQLQAQPPNGEVVLMREACYRCIGEGYPHVAPHMQFSAWFNTELSGQLAGRLPDFVSGQHDLFASVLQARALWLVGVCGQDLEPQQWTAAFRLVVQHLAAKDLVVALTAITAALGLSSLILDDQAVLERHDALKKPTSSMPGMMDALALSSEKEAEQQENSDEIAEVRVRAATRKESLGSTLVDALNGCFKLLERLTEVESMVRVLQLVSVLVEIMGTDIKPQLGIIADALPHIWSTASRVSSSVPSFDPTSTSLSGISRNGAAASGSSAGKGGSSPGGDTGALVRLHSALIAVLTHLVGKLRSVAMQDPRIQGVIFPLLQYSTNLGGPESECLVEEAFRLWNVAISSQPTVSQPLLELLPNLAHILRRGKDNGAVFPILENYLLLNAGGAIANIGPALAAALTVTTTTAAQQILAGATHPSAAPLSSEVAAEALASAALSDVMLQLYPAEVPTVLQPTFRAMAVLVAQPTLPSAGLPVKVLNVLEGCLEVLARLCIINPGALQVLLDNDAEALSRYLDKWLIIAAARFLEEIIGVKTMAMLGRFRRRIATTALCAIIAADALPAIYEPRNLARVAALSVQAILDNPAFQGDQMEMDALDFKTDLQEDFVLVKRLQMMRADIVRNVNIKDSVRAMLQKIAAASGGEAAFLAGLAPHLPNPRLAAQLAEVMRGVDLAGSENGDNDDEDEDLGRMMPQQESGGMPFTSTGSTP